MESYKTSLLLMISLQVILVSTMSTTNIAYTKIGCFKDTVYRAVPTLEGKNPILDKQYWVREHPIKKCAEAAIKAGYNIFAVQNGGWCAGGVNPAYDKYGPSKGCQPDGEGGPWANEVYTLQGFAKIGCYKDSKDRVITSLEGTDKILDGKYWQRKNSLGKCAEAARRGGFIYFALQNGGWCAASNTDKYDKLGKSDACKDDGEGGSLANQVYKMKGGTTKCKRTSCKNNGICANDGDSSFVCKCQKGFVGDACETGYTKLGCFKDTAYRAVPTLEGKTPILDKQYWVREHPIKKCAVAAIKAGYNIFAVQNGGWCAGGVNPAYDKYGPSKGCQPDGEGGPWANEVYMLHVVKDPCKLKPCENGGACLEDEETSFSCRCKPGFIGRICGEELPSPCSPNPCKNGGACEVRGNRYSCRCKPEFGGTNCEYGQASCFARGDPHYATFDKRLFNFMGICSYILAKDCKGENRFTVMQKNSRCGWGGASCTRDVTVFLHKTSPQYRIQWTRGSRVVIINGERYTTFPIIRPGFVMNNPSTLVTDFGLSVTWNFVFDVQVTVSGKYKNKMCGLCGNFDGNSQNDWPIVGLKCELPPKGCFPTEEKRLVMGKCDTLSDKSSPFAACHSTINPDTLIKNCKYDTCRCDDAKKCLCDAVGTYTGRCAAHGKIIDWRFKGSNLYQPLKHCEKTCQNPGEVFKECGSSCVKTCRDLSRDVVCNEKCQAGCQCPGDKVLNEDNECVPREECSCKYEGKTYGPGESVSVGECKTCTCNKGAMSCVKDRECEGEGPCDSQPCKNDGLCISEGDMFVCECTEDYQGDTCEDLVPKPCDVMPCKHDGICTNEDDTFSCECTEYFTGPTCETPKPRPCDSSPCKNGATCHDEGKSFYCECADGFTGETCEKTNVCESEPCKNGGTCVEDEETSFSCICKPGFIGRLCEKEPPKPCSPNPCKNGGTCEVRGNGYSCRCKPEFGGTNCEYGQASCFARGDPHYATFDKRLFNFMGICSYILANDCKGENRFTVMQKNSRCGWGGASCTRDVTVFLHKTSPQYRIQWTRGPRVVIINGERYTTFPIKRPGFVMNNPSTLVTDFGLSVTWNFVYDVQVTVSGRYKNKMCGLCGNFDGNSQNDWPIVGLKCELPPEGCFPSEEKRLIIEKCDTLGDKSSPFAACHSTIKPDTLIKNCKYDTCRCDDAKKCICDAVARYAGRCAAHGKIIDWRFKGSNLYQPLKHCEKTCQNPGEVFKECGSSCVKTCRDLSRDIVCNEKCQPGCQCPGDKVLNEDNECVPREECSCKYEGKPYGPGESVSVGECKTCTCNKGAMSCVEDRECEKEGPCDSQPCKNDGLCISEGEMFVCECTEDYQGDTCEDLVPKPCDSIPCQNNGICTNEGDAFSCECTEYYSGPMCETPEPRPCDSSPCKNGGRCHDEGKSFYCECFDGFTGETCEKPKEPCKTKPCESNPCKNGEVCEEEGNSYTCKDAECKTSKLDLLYVVDGSGSVRKKNFGKVKEFINKLNTRFDIGQDKTRLGFIQFGKPKDVQLAFNLGDIGNLEEANEAISKIKYKRYQTATGAALKKAREEVFNDNEALSGDRPGVPDVLILFTDGAATDKPKTLQLTEAAKLKGEGVKIITIGIGTRFQQEKLEEMASKDVDTSQPLFFKTSFDDIDSLTNYLVSSTCE